MGGTNLPLGADAGDCLDILAQSPLVYIYTQITLCFSVPEASAHPTIINTLTTGLERLATSFPWVAAQVVNDAGVNKFRPFERTPRLVVKDLSQDASMPTMADLREARFPARMLDESRIAPRMTLPGAPGEGPGDPTPVFLVQATFITGGLLLTLVGNHGTMDMVGQAQVMRLLSKACRNEPFTSEELSSGNLPRLDLVPLLEDSYDPTPEVAHQIIKPKPPVQADSGAAGERTETFAPPGSFWAYFIFSRSSLTSLKSLATEAVTDPPGFVSTDDALTAFVWQSVVRARRPRLDPSARPQMTRAVDVRHFLHVPDTYPGMIQNLTYHQSSLQDLVKSPLGLIASRLRTAVDPRTSNLAHATRALAMYISRAEDRNLVSLTADINGSVDITPSSWVKIDCYAMDFGLELGLPEAVRRPKFLPCEGLMYFMPRAPNGEVALLLCLREDDMERLKADEEFTKHAEYVG
ncbi:Trichothecene 3-O-acetyltransferase [Pleurostoma richardsiae]|uniref:Trichothecene 3-O-acetyltransferase n=1 Tax=Pleurostoma richardsiae TaxID=41990 RepID=A0AA38VPJ0_9PEZI|nr:Trichothecene 3-O-acetyltransferase [Pleurostoma richardsiae]